MKISLFLLLIIFSACNHQSKVENQSSSLKTAIKDSQLKIVGDHFSQKVFGEGSFGYDVYNGNQLIIHQPVIPGVAGNAGFKTKEEATRTAHLVIEKLSRGQIPPTVSLEELKQLKVHY